MRIKSKILNIAIVGCGRVAEHYREKVFNKNFFKIAKILAVSDKSLIKAKKYANLINSEFYKDYKDFNFYKNIDLVLIMTSSGSHYEIARFFLKKKIHVLCEKPLTMTSEKAIVLDKLSKNNKVHCGVIFQNRFNKSIKFLENLVINKKFGKIISVSISLLWSRFQKYYDDEWHGKWKEDGGVINQQAIHHIDVMRWLFGPVISVSAVKSNRLNELEAEDTMHAILKFKKNFNGSIEATTATRPKDLKASITVLGERGTIEIGGLALNEIKYFEMKNFKINSNQVKKKYSEKVKNGYGNSHCILVNETIKRLLNKNLVPLVSCKEALLTTNLVHSIYVSCENNKWIDLSRNKKSKYLGYKN